MFMPTLRCECAQPASDRLMRKWCIIPKFQLQIHYTEEGTAKNLQITGITFLIFICIYLHTYFCTRRENKKHN